MQRVLITGGSGFVGVNLARDLHARGFRLTTLDVAPFTYADLRDVVDHRLGDIRDADAVDAAMRGQDAVVHAAAALPRHRPSEIRSIDVDGTRTVLEAASRHGVARVVHLSTTAVYGIPGRVPMRESDPLRAIGPYGEAKVAAERLCDQYRARGLVVAV